jgi:diguanylate cyclase (GGDEF)-like protein
MAVGRRHEDDVDLTCGEHFSCSLSRVVIARVYEFGGDGAVEALLRRAGSARSQDYLCDIGNWISYAEAVALWRAGAEITHHPDFAYQVGIESARRLNGSPVATMLRSLGSPENVYRVIATTSTKYGCATTLEAIACEPGHAEIVARPLPGFPRDPDHCSWTRGLLATITLLFGLPPAEVEHETCAAFGAPACHYHVRWEAAAARARSQSGEEVDKLRDQLDAMKERLHSMFQTASDLIASGDVDDVLSRIADRAAMEVRAPHHMLVVRMSPDGPLHVHQKGFEPDEVDETVQTLLANHPSELPASWLAVPIRSSRCDYGYLLAVNAREVAFLTQERELLEVYARYAASALDSASALLEAESRYGQSSALLELARALSVAGTSSEVARRLADSVPVVVDCDQVAVYVWSGTELVREATTENADIPPAPELAFWHPQPGSTLEGLLTNPRPDPLFIDSASGDAVHVAALKHLGFEATIIVPLVSGDALLGVLAVAVRERPERLRPTPDLLDRLSGVGAQAGVALQNGRLVDMITYQALHDQLTGLANRVQFTTELRDAVGRAARTEEFASLFYIDLDRFKPVNDEFGHEAGDALLVAVADRLRQHTRATDVVARLGGDEFAVLVVAPGHEEIEAVTRRLAAGFERPFALGDQEISLAVSIGRSIFPADASDADGLLRRADEAMFADKRSRQAERGAAADRVA